MVRKELATKDDLKPIWDHIETTNQEMGEIQKLIAAMRTDISWLKKNQWVVVSGIAGLIILIGMKTALGI